MVQLYELLFGSVDDVVPSYYSCKSGKLIFHSVLI